MSLFLPSEVSESLPGRRRLDGMPAMISTPWTTLADPHIKLHAHGHPQINLSANVAFM